MKKHVVVDVSNIFWRSISAMNKYDSPNKEEAAALGLHGCLVTLKKHYNNIKPNEVAIVFEGKNNWRKEYTKSSECYSGRLYKGNRIKDPSMAVLYDVMDSFKELAKDCTALTVLQHDHLEGDDLIAGYAQYHAALNDEVIILSGDRDFVQLLDNRNISIVNPADGSKRTLFDSCGVDSAEYFMFEKCFRGDPGDNVLPALPRVRGTKLQKAFGVKDGTYDPLLTDSFELSNLFNSTWNHIHPETGESRIMHVQKMFEENNTLMNLSAQPDHIRKLINEVIEDAKLNRAKFNFFKFNKFLGENNLAQIAEHPQDFIKLLS